MRITRHLAFLLLVTTTATFLVAGAAERETVTRRERPRDEPRITLYERPHFRGASIDVLLGEEVRDLRSLRFPDGSRVDDRVSSIEISRGVQARIYENDGFRGEYLDLSHSIDNLTSLARAGGTNWNDVISSLRVLERPRSQPREQDPSRTPRVIVFSRKHYAGEAFEIYPGENLENLKRERFESGADLNDEISSIRIVGPLRVRLYLDTKYRGEHLDVTADVADCNDLRRANPKHDWNDKASSLTVEWAEPFEPAGPGPDNGGPE